MSNLNLKSKEIRLNELSENGGILSKRPLLKGFCRNNPEIGEIDFCLYSSLKSSKNEDYGWINGKITEIRYNKDFNKHELIINNQKRLIITEL